MSKKNIVLFLGDFDPPTDDVRHACTNLYNHPETESVWLCPITTQEHVADLCNIFCHQFSLETSKKITLCRVAIDKKLDGEELLSWIRQHYPSQEFKVATFDWDSEIKDKNPVFRVCFSAGEVLMSSRTCLVAPIIIRNAPCVSPMIKERIKSGKDESRKMYRTVWEHIQRKKLYRS